MRALWAMVAAVAGLLAQEAVKAPEPEIDFVCPMDKDVRSKSPGKCPRCGMKLVAGIAGFEEYPVILKVTPRAPRPGQPFDLAFQVQDPRGAPVKQFEVMHEKLFHLFLLSEDLEFFAHEHPELDSAGVFRYRTTVPKAGAYRAVTDFYPTGGSPQMSSTTLFVGGRGSPPPPLKSDLAPKRGKNLEVELVTEPPAPLAGFKTLMFFKLKSTAGEFNLEPYLGAWGHMLAASEDLIDLVHTHPFLADGGPQVQFNMIFPREGLYRVWVQFQSKGELNTLSFTLPVKPLR